MNITKIYLSRSQTKSMAAWEPIGDPFGGAAYGEYRDPVSAIVGGSVLGGVMQSNAAQGAANTQAAAQRDAAASQERMFNQTRDDQAPWRQAGGTAIGQLSSMTAPGGSLTHQFDASDLANGLAPNYNFIKQQGTDALNNSNTVSNGLIGGNALKGAIDYNQNLAGSAYQQAFNNFQTGQNNIFNRLSGIAGLGSTAASNSATGASSFSNGIASSIGNVGSALGAGQVASSNALTGGLNNVSNMYLANNMTGGKLFNGLST